MATLVNIISGMLLLGGGFIGITGAVGLFRLQDFYTRIHASGVTDTLCSAMIIVGLVLQSGLTLASIKLVFILGLLWFTSPISSHAFAKAAFLAGLRPMTATDKD